MALTTTTLAAAITKDDLTIPVTSATGFATGNFMRIGNEFIGAIIAVNGTQISVRGRGDQGTAAVPHKILEPVVTGLASVVGATPADYPDIIPGGTVPVEPTAENIFDSYGADGAITPPQRSGTITINKATAAALTLAAPSKGVDGIQVTFLSTTAAAHTITYTAGFYGDTTSSDVATFAAKAGASMTVEAIKGTWGIVALGNVTLA